MKNKSSDKTVKQLDEHGNINSRLTTVLNKDKQINPKYIKDIIKSDFFYLINNYFEVEFQDVNIDISLDNNNKYIITINSLGDRLKLMRTIPD